MTKAIIITIAVIAVGYIFVHWTIQHDAKQEAAYSAYDTCVQANYGESAASYYQEHGTLPSCN